jgi:hypothetical protein
MGGSAIGYVRVTGQNNPIHHQGAVLAVSDNPGVVNSEMISVNQARAMVQRREAQWVRDDEQAEISEPAPARAARHSSERETLDDKHDDERNRLLRGYISTAEPPAARAQRHLAEQNAALSSGANRADFLALVHRQEDEPKAEAAARFDQHERMKTRQEHESADLQERQARENAPPAAAPPPAPKPPPTPPPANRPREQRSHHGR